MLKLVRFYLGKSTYKKENEFFRDSGRSLATIRDASVLIKTFKKLKVKKPDEISEKEYNNILNNLINNKKEEENKFKEKKLTVDVNVLKEAESRIKKWNINNNMKPAKKALRKTYKQARKAFNKIIENPSPDNFHEWRKKVKYLWYEVKVFKESWPPVLGKLVKELHSLSDKIGLLHDYYILREYLCNNSGIADSTAIKHLVEIIDYERAGLRVETKYMGEKIFTEKPKKFAKRISTYYKISQKDKNISKEIDKQFEILNHTGKRK